MKSLFTLILLIATFQTTKIDKLHFLAGTWKMENKESYETWAVMGKESLEGSSYKLKDGKKVVDEYLTIKMNGNKISYYAKVLNQNNGQAVEFTLNEAIKDKFSFENASHDFPKKIQYTKKDERTLLVAVLGDKDKGFSYTLIKQ